MYKFVSLSLKISLIFQLVARKIVGDAGDVGEAHYILLVSHNHIFIIW